MSRKKLKQKVYLLFLYSFFLLLIGCSKVDKIQTENFTKQQIILVKVPPIYDKKLSRGENWWRFHNFLFPQIEIPNPVPKGLPNDDSYLTVSLADAGKIKINNTDVGHISETRQLTELLSKTFREREINGVYEPGNWKVVKAVGINISHSVKHEEFIKIVDAVNQSGAEPIVLLFDDDGRIKRKIDLSTGIEIE